jgi:hypothetical protein
MKSWDEQSEYDVAFAGVWLIGVAGWVLVVVSSYINIGLQAKVADLTLKQQGYAVMLNAMPLDARNQNGRKK